MTYALFANNYETTEGGWNDHVTHGTLDECMAVDLDPEADWAHVVDLETGDTVVYKSHANFTGDIRAAACSRPGEIGSIPVDDIRVPVRLKLSQAEAVKLWSLGGVHWLRVQLANAPEPPTIPEDASTAECLQIISRAALPFAVHGWAAEPVRHLHAAGLIEAEIHIEDAPEGDWAVVLAMTPAGKSALLR